MGIHASGEANEDLVAETPPDTGSTPRQLVESVQIARSYKGIDVTLSETMRGIGTASELREVRAPTQAVYRVPRRETQPGTGSRVPNRETSTINGPSAETNHSTAWPEVPRGGITVETDVIDSTYDSIRSIAHETVSTRRHSASTQRKKWRCVDSSDRPVSTGVEMVDTRFTLGNRSCSPTRHPRNGGG